MQVVQVDMLKKGLHIEDGDVLNADQRLGGLVGNCGRFPGVHGSQPFHHGQVILWCRAPPVLAANDMFMSLAILGWNELFAVAIRPRDLSGSEMHPHLRLASHHFTQMRVRRRIGCEVHGIQGLIWVCILPLGDVIGDNARECCAFLVCTSIQHLRAGNREVMYARRLTTKASVGWCSRRTFVLYLSANSVHVFLSASTWLSDFWRSHKKKANCRSSQGMCPRMRSAQILDTSLSQTKRWRWSVPLSWSIWELKAKEGTVRFQR